MTLEQYFEELNKLHQEQSVMYSVGSGESGGKRYGAIAHKDDSPLDNPGSFVLLHNDDLLALLEDFLEKIRTNLLDGESDGL